MWHAVGLLDHLDAGLTLRKWTPCQPLAITIVAEPAAPGGKAGEGRGGLGRVDFGQSCRCFGAGIGIEGLIGHDAAQGLGRLGLVDFGQSCRRLKAVVMLVFIHEAHATYVPVPQGMKHPPLFKRGFPPGQRASQTDPASDPLDANYRRVQGRDDHGS